MSDAVNVTAHVAMQVDNLQFATSAFHSFGIQEAPTVCLAGAPLFEGRWIPDAGEIITTGSAAEG